MLKYGLTLLIGLCINLAAKSQPPDTLVTYFKYRGGSIYITTPDSAQFVRMVLPPDDGDDRVNVREYDMNGRMIFLGKYDGIYKRKGYPYKTGSCITFYPNGKRKSIINYTLDQKYGDEYRFFPSGKIYYYIKNATVSGYNDRVEHLECYDAEGNQVCKDGNGIWLVYNNSYNNVMFTGPVKKGQYEGIWNGRSELKDSIKYNCIFDKGIFTEGRGYDKAGHPHKFTQDIIAADYPENKFTFLQMLRERLNLPKDKDGRKLSLKGAIISFVVEKDGSLSNGEIFNNENPEATANLNAALSKFKKWIPRQHYGVPFRSRITIPIKEEAGYTDRFSDSRTGGLYLKQIEFKEQVLDL